MMLLRWAAKVSDGKGDNHCDSEEMEMGFNVLSGGGGEVVKSKRFIVKPRIKVWLARAITTVILWTSVVQLMALGELWGPRLLLKGMPYCFSHPDVSPAVAITRVPAKVVLPTKSKSLL